MEYIGAAAAAAGSIISGYAQNKFNMDSQEDVQDYQKWMFLHRYRMQMEDMQKAGLNPMLSASATPPGAPSGTGGASGSAPDIVGALASAQQMKRAGQDIDTSKTQAQLNQANAGKASADTALSLQQSNESAKRQEKMDAEISRIKPEARSASAKAYEAEQDADRRKLVGPKSWYTDAAETATRTLNGVMGKLGLLNETPKRAADRERVPEFGGGMPPRPSSAKEVQPFERMPY